MASIDGGQLVEASRVAAEPVLDLEFLRGSTGGNRERAQRLVTSVMRDFPNHLATLLEASNNGDAETALRMAHSIKGLAGYVGAQRVYVLAAAAEVRMSKGTLSSVDSVVAPPLKHAILEALDGLRRIDWDAF